MYFETECEMAVQGHPRSLISVPIESAYVTFYWSSIVSLVLSCPVSEIYITDFLLRTSTQPLFHSNFGGVLLGLDSQRCGSEERRP